MPTKALAVQANGPCGWAGLKRARQDYRTAHPSLRQAANDGDTRRAARLLAQGGDVNARSVHGLTALHWAVLAGERKMVILLLQHGAKVDARDGKGQTPLHYAAGGGGFEIAQLLLDAGADPNARKARGETPFALAGFKQSETARKLLLLPDRQKVAELLQQHGGHE